MILQSHSWALSRENPDSKSDMHPSVHSSATAVAKTWKQLKCPRAAERMKNMWYTLWNNACMQSHFSCVWLFATLWTIAHPVSFVHRILQARILECIVMPSSRVSSPPRDQTHIISRGSCIADRFFTTEPPGKPRLPWWEYYYGILLNHKK